jgi:hypothetical protein
VSQLWIPGAEGPHDDFVARIHRQIGRFAQERGIEQAAVEIELRDGWRFVVDALLPEPGYGFVTIRPHPGDGELPPELIVPIGTIQRIELYEAYDKPSRFGFSLRDPEG